MINKKEIKLSSRASFHCTGARCKLSCCKLWEIAVDKSATLDRWKKITNSEQRDRLLNSVHYSEIQKRKFALNLWFGYILVIYKRFFIK